MNSNNTSWVNGSKKFECKMGQVILDPLAGQILSRMNWIVIGIGLPLIFVVFIAIVFQVKKGQDAPVYIINLLISDVFQLCIRIPLDLTRLSEVDFIYMKILYFGIMASVGFMVCISCERYLVVAKPLWYRFRRNVKIYVVVCIGVWILPLLHRVLGSVFKECEMAAIFFTVVLLLPVPFFIFFLVGTIKALSGSFSLPADEKRRIAAIQVVVLINYTLLYVPVIILIMYNIQALKGEFSGIPYAVGYVGGCLSPLADIILYVLIRKSILDKFLASLCCCVISDN